MTLPDPSRCAIEFHSVLKVFDGRPALCDVDLTIRPGARVALLGPNGAGKTTAIRLMTGRLRPSRGEVRVLGLRPGSAEFRERRKRIGIVPQGPGMYADLTAGEYLDLAAASFDHGKVADVVALLGLEAQLATLMSRLSGGYQRRVVFASALLAQPELLLLDEPTVGLDALAAHETRQQLAPRLAGRTVILCTHDLAEAETLCDDVIMLRAGRVLVHEPIAALRARAGTRLRLTTRQPPADVMARLPPGSAASSTGDRTIVTGLGRGEVPALLRALVDDGVDVFEARIEELSLEELFVRVMQG